MSKQPIRKVIITGADSTARVVAETFAGAGARVCVCDVRPEALEAIKADNPEIFAMRADMGEEAEVAAFMTAAIDEMNGVDFLINVVGVPGPSKPTEEITLDEWRASMAINLTGVFLTVKAAIPHMKAQRFGGVVNFSSGSTRTLPPNRSPYVVSKFGVEGFTRTLARELGPYNVRANAILPGAIDNARMRAVTERVAAARGVTREQASADLLKYISMRTMVQPSELADTVFFLCSDAARHVTGQLIGVDGNVEWEE